MKKYKGVSIVGTLVAISIMTIVFIPIFDLQASIIKSRFFLQYDATAVFLSSEGLEITKSIFSKGSGANDPNNWLNKFQQGRYSVSFDNNRRNLTAAGYATTCTINNLNNTCALSLDNGSYIDRPVQSGPQIFYRFVDLKNSNTGKINVTSTVVVVNARYNSKRVYQTFSELFATRLAQ